MRRGDCSDHGYMLSHFYFISFGTTVKLGQFFKMGWCEFWVLFYVLSSECYVQKALTQLKATGSKSAQVEGRLLIYAVVPTGAACTDRHGSHTAWVYIPAFPLASSVALDPLLNLLVPQFPSL